MFVLKQTGYFFGCSIFQNNHSLHVCVALLHHDKLFLFGYLFVLLLLHELIMDKFNALAGSTSMQTLTNKTLWLVVVRKLKGTVGSLWPSRVWASWATPPPAGDFLLLRCWSSLFAATRGIIPCLVERTSTHTEHK